MQLNIDIASTTPLYKQIVDSITLDIHSGTLPSGTRLPTVRQLADEAGIARGTVKHAYDELEQMGFIEKTQGRGTFVSASSQPQSASKKEQAMHSIDCLLVELEELAFSLKDIRIILDLKLREREQQHRGVRIGAVDCSPEALSMISRQVSSIPYVDVYEYPLERIMRHPRSLPENLDLVITTSTHYQELGSVMSQPEKLYRMALSISPQTVSQLARIPAEACVTILCASRRFGEIMEQAYLAYSLPAKPPVIAQFGDKDKAEALIRDSDQLILPANYLQFCAAQEQAAILARKTPPVIYQYEIDKGSLLHLDEHIEKIYKANEADN